jgi:hypothetical protein
LLDIDNTFKLYSVINNRETSKHFSNVAIAAAITAYSIIIIAPYKRIGGNECFYSDTDSVFIQNKLDSSLIGADIGQIKLEYQIHIIFISPKLYGFVTGDNTTIIKVKGFNSDIITMEDIESL